MLIYELAFHLKTPVFKLKHEMPYEELLGWVAYFERRPIGWREDDRTHKLLQAQGVKAKAVEIFPSLQALYAPKPVINKADVIDPGNLKSSSFFQKMLLAKGGDKLNL